jgi:hypothetical protein
MRAAVKRVGSISAGYKPISMRDHSGGRIGALSSRRELRRALVPIVVMRLFPP